MSVKIFFCYAHEDEQLLNRLKSHLSPLRRQGLIEMWYDRDINAGTEWEQAIKEHLDSAQIILLLISPDFMNSEYCYSIEMQQAIEKHHHGETCVIPVILRPVAWQGVLGNLQALPKDGRPVRSRYWHNIDEAFSDITQGVGKTIRNLSSKKISDIVNIDNFHYSTTEQINDTPTIANPEYFKLKAKEQKTQSDDAALTENEKDTTVPMVRKFLYVKNGQEQERTYVIESSLSLGRQLDNDIVLDDNGVSRRHALVYIDDNGTCILKDVGSVNGTIVNGKILKKDETHVLNGGDEILIGRIILFYRTL